MSYYIAKTVARPFDHIVVEVTARLRSEGFSVLSDIDLQHAFAVGTGAGTSGYRILGTCIPLLVQEALRIEDKLGALLPCNVIVHEMLDRRVEVASVDPVTALNRSSDPALTRIAFELRRRLASVVQGIQD